MEATVDEDNVVLKTAADVTAVSSCVPGMERCMEKEVLSAIQRDLTAADIRWSLFVAACQSYKQDSCLRPFPPMFLVDGTKDFSALMEAIETVPPFVQLESSIHTLLKKTLMLLHWLLVELKDPSLTVVNKSKVWRSRLLFDRQNSGRPDVHSLPQSQQRLLTCAQSACRLP
ncbi:G2/mitotic-specific cyclin-B2 [Homalodisca vitripennis]|nr:G2/mitotic-specific cyclin-B2 [Homalodisca vitripennis]KAG8275137.1 G2/mitotic-specific cyclin-B2 [Homalodisca vitripennis]